jgi:hypothetical protein
MADELSGSERRRRGKRRQDIFWDISLVDRNFIPVLEGKIPGIIGDPAFSSSLKGVTEPVVVIMA